MMLDPTAADPREVAHIIPEKFWIRYVQEEGLGLDGKPSPQVTPRVTPVEMVLWAKKGQHITTGQKTSMRITQARREKQIWAVLEPYYNAWKAGQDAPLDGTALGAWPGVTPDQVDRLKMLRIRTVEDVAAMTDNDVDSFGMGGLSIRQQARAFMEMKKDRTAIAAEVSSQIGAFRDEIADLKAQLAAKSTTEEAPKRRGRPAKSEAA